MAVVSTGVSHTLSRRITLSFWLSDSETVPNLEEVFAVRIECPARGHQPS